MEGKLKELITLYTYAAIQDILSEYEGDRTFNPFIEQSYENLCKPKQERKEGLKNIFVLSTDVPQMIVQLYTNISAEIKNTELNADETIENIIGKITAANIEAWTAKTFGAATRYVPQFGPTLRGAADPANLLYAKFNGDHESLKTRIITLSKIVTEFNNFIKAIAIVYAREFWFTHVSLSRNWLCGFLYNNNFSLELIDIVCSGIKERPPRKASTAPRKKKDATVTTTGDAATGNTTTEATAPANGAPANGTTAPKKAEITDEDILNAL